MHAKFEGENLKIERAVSILVKWVSIMWSNLKTLRIARSSESTIKEVRLLSGYETKDNIINIE
jgi:hypothetical protein